MSRKKYNYNLGGRKNTDRRCLHLAKIQEMQGVSNPIFAIEIYTFREFMSTEEFRTSGCTLRPIAPDFFGFLDRLLARWRGSCPGSGCAAIHSWGRIWRGQGRGGPHRSPSIKISWRVPNPRDAWSNVASIRPQACCRGPKARLLKPRVIFQ